MPAVLILHSILATAAVQLHPNSQTDAKLRQQVFCEDSERMTVPDAVLASALGVEIYVYR